MYKICARARSAAILPLWGGAKKLLRSAPDQSATFVTAPIAAAAEPTPTRLRNAQFLARAQLRRFTPFIFRLASLAVCLRFRRRGDFSSLSTRTEVPTSHEAKNMSSECPRQQKFRMAKKIFSA